jgi:hypothetical protein
MTCALHSHALVSLGLVVDHTVHTAALTFMLLYITQLAPRTIGSSESL